MTTPRRPAFATIQASPHRVTCMQRFFALMMSALFLTACGSAPVSTPVSGGSCTLPLPEDATDEQAIQAVLAGEGTFVVAQDITSLMALWAEDGHVADAKNTSGNSEDDQRWLNKDAIRHRYVRTVFPGAPSEVSPADLEIEISGEEAVVIATTNIGSEIAPAGDRWELVKIGDCWQLKSLTYNLESSE